MASGGPPSPLRLIRQSGALEIYEARGSGGEPIIVKRIDPELARADEIGRRRFAREMHLATALNHPSLPRVVARGENWIGFERLDGSLAEPAIAGTWHPPARAVHLLTMLADTLAYVHARGVVHGDIKPAHVMFRGDRPVLIDFGIASVGGGESFSGELAGTPAWMAPEQVISPGRDPGMDIWSLAAVIIFLITRIRPYTGSAEDVLALRRTGARPAFQLADDIRTAEPEVCGLLEEMTGAPEGRPTAAAIVRRLAIRG